MLLVQLTTGTPAEKLLMKTEKRFLEKIVDNIKVPDIVKPGTAVAQRYGLGPGWVQKRMFDRVKICGADSYCSKVTDDEAWNYYSVGPPYLLHYTDFQKVAIKWWEFMRPVYKQDRGDIQADMVSTAFALSRSAIPNSMNQPPASPSLSMPTTWQQLIKG